MRSLFARFRYSNMFTKISHPGMDLKNQLFQLSDSQNKLLSTAWQSQTNLNIKSLHEQVMTTIPKMEGLTLVKSVALHYMQINCQHQQFWLEVGNQLEKILLMRSWNQKTFSYFYQLAFIFGQIKRKQLIKDEQVINQYKKCSEILLQTISYDVLNQNPQNISHIISLIAQYDINSPFVTKIAQQLQGKTNFSQFKIEDLILYFWSLKSSTNSDFVKIGVYGFHNEEVINIIQAECKQLDSNLWSKLLIIIAQFKPRNEKFINFIVNSLPIFELKQLVSLIAIYIKTSFNQSQCLFPILLCLKTQFLEHFENENKDPQITLDGIKFLTFIPAQMSHHHRLLLADKIDVYGRYILYNLQHFDQSHLIDVLCMANCFKEKQAMLDLIQNRLQPYKMTLDIKIFFLLNIIQYESQFTQHINDCLNQLNKMRKEIFQLHDDKHLQLMLALYQLEEKYPIAQELLSLRDQQKLLRQFETFVNKVKRESLISDTGFGLHFKFFQGFMSNNFEFNLYICEILGVFKYMKEARINMHLLDYRLYDIQKDKFNFAKLKQMQQDSNLLNQFLKIKYSKFDDVKIDRDGDQKSLFIEVDGQNHFDLMGQPINRTVCKKEQLKKCKLNLYTISLDENTQIANSLKTIEEILNK